MPVSFEGYVLESIYRVSNFIISKSDTIHTMPRAYHGIVYFFNGNNEYIYNGERFAITANTFLYLPKGLSYTMRRYEDALCIVIDFDTAMPVAGKPFCISFKGGNEKLSSLFNSAASVYVQKKAGYQNDLLSIVYKIFSFLQESENTHYICKSQYSRLTPATEYIAENFADPDLRVSSLASMCSMSMRYFTKLFSAYYGCPPKEYILNMRLDRAKALLSDTILSITRISQDCGFSDVYYFSKLFKKTMHVPPSDYRRINIKDR